MDSKLNIKSIITTKAPKCSYSNCIQRLRCPSINEQNEILWFKSCHYCFTFYCSKICRKLDWEEHKNIKCLYGRLSSYCKRILVKIGRHKILRNQLTNIAKSSYFKSMRRGFICLDFSYAESAKDFLNKQISLNDNSDFSNLFNEQILPKYVCIETSNNSNQNNSIISQLFFNAFKDNNRPEFKAECEIFNELCFTYNPTKEFILVVTIKINKTDNNTSSFSTSKSKYILKFLKIPFINENLNSQFQTIFNDKYDKINKQGSNAFGYSSAANNEPLTLILTSLKGTEISETNNNPNKNSVEDRELFLANLLSEFENRSINLRKTYPILYRDLCLYVSENKPLTPICLFPRDLTKNNLFMCLIMPNSEPTNYSFLFEEQKIEES